MEIWGYGDMGIWRVDWGGLRGGVEGGGIGGGRFQGFEGGAGGRWD